jgi:eight-cysteine-cluster-containing protein
MVRSAVTVVLGLFLSSATLMAACDDGDGDSSPVDRKCLLTGNCPPSRHKPCVVGGCSGQVCADEPLASTCEWRPEYGCYKAATCERQADGKCGWTKTAELTACLNAAK